LSEFEIIVASIFLVLNYVYISKTIKYKHLNEVLAKVVIDKIVAPKG